MLCGGVSFDASSASITQDAALDEPRALITQFCGKPPNLLRHVLPACIPATFGRYLSLSCLSLLPPMSLHPVADVPVDVMDLFHGYPPLGLGSAATTTRYFTYSIPPSVAHEILYRRIPLLADVMAVAFGIVDIIKELEASSVTPNQFAYAGTEHHRVRQLAYSITHRICQFLVAIFTPGPADSGDRRPYIARPDRIDVKLLRDALMTRYDSIKILGQSSFGLYAFQPELQVGRTLSFSGLPESYIFDSAQFIAECPWIATSAGEVSSKHALPSLVSEIESSYGSHNMVEIYLEALRRAEDVLARELITPDWICETLLPVSWG